MPAGKRDRLVTIEQSTETQSVGEPVLTWTVLTRWWAEKLPLGGSEGPAGGQDQYATARYEWRGLSISGVVPKMRINEGGVFHDIDFVDETRGRQNVLRLVTTQRGV